MERQLVPVPNLRRRVIVLAVLLVPVLLAWRIGLVAQLLACVLPVVFTGTYRVSRLTGDRFDTQFRFGFVPISRDQCRLPAVVFIHTHYHVEQSWASYLLFFVFGPVQWLLGHLFDYLLPAIGGPYEIWLETAKGREVLAWNGYSQEYFEKNLELLRARTGAEVRFR